jgi:protein tyrosine/serine phosphatase
MFLLSALFAVACSDAESNPQHEPGSCMRCILGSQVTNARDLGGWPAADGSVACKRYLRGGALTSLAGEGCEEFSKLGVKTIIDLREQDVQAPFPSPECATKTALHLSASLPKLLPDTPEHYLALMNEGLALRQIFSVLSSAVAYPVFVHCEIGRDRASFVTALVLLTIGASPETVMQEFLLSNDAGVPVKEGCISAVLDEIAARDGIAGYLESIGVDNGVLGSLRQNLVEEAI